MNRTRTAALVLATTVASATVLGTVGSGSAAEASESVRTASSSSSSSASWGWTAAADHRLKRGCHSYPFHYSVDAPSDSWQAELRLVGPHGAHVASNTFSNGSYRRTGVGHWTVCSANASTGAYTIRMKVTSYDEYSGDATSRDAKTSRFHLTKR